MSVSPMLFYFFGQHAATVRLSDSLTVLPVLTAPIHQSWQ